MSIEPQYPGPATPPTSTPQQHRRPRKLAREPAPAREESSAGGVLLSNSIAATSSQNSQTEPSSSKDPNAPATTGSNRKRRPRKLKKDRPADGAAGSGPSNAANNEGEGAVNHELEALKSRVRGLEAKVEELYKTSPGRSPRRRGKGRKGSKPADPAPANAAAADAAAEAANDAELQRLEGELASARQDLATASRPSRQRPARTASGGDDVEEVPRLSGPAVEGDKDSKAVTLSGSYRIPLPASVSMSDVRNIQSGIASAHAVARGFLDARHADAPRSPPRRNSAGGGGGGGQGQSWSEWFGAYSMSISRAVKIVEADAALETAGQRSAAKRPVAGPRRASAPGAGAKAGGSGIPAQKKAAGPGAGVRPSGTGKAASTATRPPLNPRTSNTTPTG
jgi:hypothetical protein